MADKCSAGDGCLKDVRIALREGYGFKGLKKCCEGRGRLAEGLCVCVCVAQLYGGRELEDSERIVRAGEGVCVCLCGACTLRFGEEIAGKVAEGCHQWCSFH